LAHKVVLASPAVTLGIFAARFVRCETHAPGAHAGAISDELLLAQEPFCGVKGYAFAPSFTCLFAFGVSPQIADEKPGIGYQRRWD
jgi:hypothetical protein